MKSHDMNPHYNRKKLIHSGTKSHKKTPFGQLKKQVKRLKIKLFLLITLPVFIVTLARTVWKEYSRAKIRQAASKIKSSFTE